ncbi:hypothetical protein BABINDRAFT_176070 [Babjeviella inositovora NRRL Y-12698]|uniref:3-deoxy-D-arabino-heptulosonate 7-phosphate synthase n=1 Tax=Babjeviella inositovora NRRL Y-12698 TaxID=984486 RepID=A0A1E3QQE5_9ASCO|nr:uncharacterized protein BABINDRAFT_176070 [Babjeviella inositovora NRRL Y-12698]ODQ79915.1 hypothetical protein BABINDRAFT_176070 [Babjeviella inositovora NRRL Y-12698]
MASEGLESEAHEKNLSMGYSKFKNGTVLTFQSSIPPRTLPKWEYGTTRLESRDISSSGSFYPLELAGQLVIPQPDVIQNQLYPISQNLADKILKHRKAIDNSLWVATEKLSQNLVSLLLIFLGPSSISDKVQAESCAKWIGSGLRGVTSHDVDPRSLPPSIQEYYPCDKYYFHPETCKFRPTLPLEFPHSMKYRDMKFLMRANLGEADYKASNADGKNGTVQSFLTQHGLPLCRSMLSEMAKYTAILGDISDIIAPQYLSDLYSASLMGPSVIESQIHRELVSGVSYSVGMGVLRNHALSSNKVSSEKIRVAVNSIISTNEPHSFLSVNKLGMASCVSTAGNPDTFIVLPVAAVGVLEWKQLFDMVYDDIQIECGDGKSRFRWHQSARIVIDIGMIENDTDLESKFDIVKQILRVPGLRRRILGFQIDSGDHYVPSKEIPVNREEAAVQIPLLTPKSSTEQGTPSLQHVLSRLVSKISKRLVLNEETLRSKATDIDTHRYRYFINANLFIERLLDLIATIRGELE